MMTSITLYVEKNPTNQPKKSQNKTNPQQPNKTQEKPNQKATPG